MKLSIISCLPAIDDMIYSVRRFSVTSVLSTIQLLSTSPICPPLKFFSYSLLSLSLSLSLHPALVNLSRALNRSDPAGCSALMHACSPLPQKEDEEEDEGTIQ
jgi:hypothetical protein